MIKFCCNQLAESYGVIIFGLVPRLNIQSTEEQGGEIFVHKEKIYYCPFCGEKLQNLGQTLEELKKATE